MEFCESTKVVYSDLYNKPDLKGSSILNLELDGQFSNWKSREKCQCMGYTGFSYLYFRLIGKVPQVGLNDI